MKITLNRQRALGDVIFVEPVARALSSAGHEVHVQTDVRQVFFNHPCVHLDAAEDSLVINLDRAYERHERYGNKLAQLHYLDEVQKVIGVDMPDPLPKLYLTKKERDDARQRLHHYGKWAVIDSGYGVRNQEWPSEAWQPFLRYLKDKGYRLVFIGHKKHYLDPLDSLDLDLRHQTSIRQLMSIIGAADLFIGPDSGPLHIANALGVPGVGIFGVVHPSLRLPKGSSVRSVVFHDFNTAALIEEVEQLSKPIIRNIHRLDRNNVGDMASPPVNYFKFRNHDIHRRDIHSQDVLNSPDSVVILGGGGLTWFGNALQRILDRHKGVLIGWGLGDNRWTTRLNYPDFDFSRCDLLGVRDIVDGYEWVPCASCMSELFDQEYEVEHDYVIYEHQDHRIDFAGPKMDNSKDLKTVIPFIGSGEVVLTSTYHGMYWATLMGKKVMVVPKKITSSFYHSKHPPVISDKLEDMKRTRSYPEALGECREANEKFYNKVLEFLGGPIQDRKIPKYLHL